MPAMTLEDISKQLRKIDFCMLNTNGGSGSITARPMSNNGDVEYDGDSWFFSYEETRKVADINLDARASLTFTAPPSLLGKPGMFLAIDGEALVIRDKSQFERHWVRDLDRWFPDGVDTAGIVLIKISAKAIEDWDGEEYGRLSMAGLDAVAGGAV